MKNYLLKYLTVILKKYIFISIISIIILFTLSTKNFANENVFTINKVEVQGPIDINFSREKYLNRAFSNSFKILMNKILLTRDLEKVREIKLKQIKNLISSFQIIEESYKGDVYRADIKILYNEKKIKDYLSKKNISFTLPENISAVFFPVLYINGNLQSFSENFFYTSWEKIKIKNELINFILPIEDLDDIFKIEKMKNNLVDLDVSSLVNKYNEKNYVFAFINYESKKMNIYLKTNFNENKTSKNLNYNLNNIKNEERLNFILKDLKVQISDSWKEQNLINLLMPLTIQLKFEHSKIKDLDKLRQILNTISLIKSYNLEEFNINNSFYKINYYGNPKKLTSELFKFGYKLTNNQGVWQISYDE